jgi:hypothetical protein
MAGRLDPQFGVHQRLHADRSKAMRAHQRGHFGLRPPAEQRQAIVNPIVFVAPLGRASVAFDHYQPSARPQEPAPSVERGLRMGQRPDHMAYKGKTLRENLGLPRPTNRFFSNGRPNHRQ